MIISLAGTNLNETYRSNIVKAMGVANGGGDVKIDIVSEPENPYDPKALRVDFNGDVVGYVPRFERDRFQINANHTSSIEEWGITEGNEAYCYLRLNPRF